MENGDVEKIVEANGGMVIEDKLIFGKIWEDNFEIRMSWKVEDEEKQVSGFSWIRRIWWLFRLKGLK